MPEGPGEGAGEPVKKTAKQLEKEAKKAAEKAAKLDKFKAKQEVKVRTAVQVAGGKGENSCIGSRR
jgi:hypothetical protein